MPINIGRDSKGSFKRWGKKGTKYYYTPNDKKSRDAAHKKALRQARAAYANGYRSS